MAIQFVVENSTCYYSVFCHFDYDWLPPPPPPHTPHPTLPLTSASDWHHRIRIPAWKKKKPSRINWNPSVPRCVFSVCFVYFRCLLWVKVQTYLRPAFVPRGPSALKKPGGVYHSPSWRMNASDCPATHWLLFHLRRRTAKQTLPHKSDREMAKTLRLATPASLHALATNSDGTKQLRSCEFTLNINKAAANLRWEQTKTRSNLQICHFIY